MHTLMLSMNIASNGEPLGPEPWHPLKPRDPGSADPQAQLAYHRALWRLRRFDNYHYTLSQRRMGVAEADLRVQVVDGVVAAVHRLDVASPVQPPPDVGTVEDYFDRIEQALMAAPGAVLAYYHSLHGYPLSVIFRGLEKSLLRPRLRA